jgi:hypothetical protein
MSRKIQVPSSKHQGIFNSEARKQKVTIWNLLFKVSLVLGDWDLVLPDEEARHGRSSDVACAVAAMYCCH